MKSRIDYLTEQIKPINEKIEEAKRGDFINAFRMPELTAQYNVLARERTWLGDVLHYILMPTRHDKWEQEHRQIRITLEFEACRIPSPYNECLFAPDDPRFSTLDLIYVDRIGAQYIYSLDVYADIPPRAFADQIVKTWLRATPRLVELRDAAYFANVMLGVFQQLSHNHMGDWRIEGALNLARNPRNNYPENVVHEAIVADSLLRSVADRVGDTDLLIDVRKLVGRALKAGKFEVDWKPFPEMRFP